MKIRNENWKEIAEAGKSHDCVKWDNKIYRIRKSILIA